MDVSQQLFCSKKGKFQFPIGISSKLLMNPKGVFTGNPGTGFATARK
jgi:hypothetical protein